jgi:hypothetical protein
MLKSKRKSSNWRCNKLSGKALSGCNANDWRILKSKELHYQTTIAFLQGNIMLTLVDAKLEQEALFTLWKSKNQ